MALDHIIDGIVREYRMYYPYRAVKDMDMAPMIKCGAMIIGDLDIRYPGYGMSAVKTILDHSRPEYLWSQTPADEISYAVSQVRSKLFNDTDFREQVLSAYESQVKPSIDRFRAYERQLRELYTDPFISSMSDWKYVAKIYSQYRQSDKDEMDRLYLLGDMPLEFISMIDAIDSMERRYVDLIGQDLKDVPKSVYERLGIKDAGLGSDKYGILFPYLYMVKHLQTLSDQNYFGNLN